MIVSLLKPTRKIIPLLALAALLACAPVHAQIIFSEDFQDFAGAGFASPPGPGQLDSAHWRVLGMSDGAGSFGGNHTAGDFARGASNGGVSSGGIYAFSANGDVLLGVQPAGSDFTPGSFDLRIENTTAQTIEALEISYNIVVFNDQNRANSLNFEWSLDDTSYSPVPELDFLTPEAADGSPAWVSTPRSTTLSNLTLAPGEFIFLRWSSNDVSGGGSRDEFGIDDVQVTIVPPPAITLTATGDDLALAGENLGASITIGNPSTGDNLENVVLTATLPADLGYVSDSSGVTPVVAANTIEWDFGNLPAQGDINFDLVLSSNLGIAGGSTLTTSFEISAELSAELVETSDSFDTLFAPLLTIPEIQEVSDPATDDASPVAGQVVFTGGIVTAAPGDFGATTIVIQTAAGGPWSGLIVDGDFSALSLARGDEVRVAGEVAEDFGLTRLSATDVELLGQGTLPAPVLLTTGAFPEQAPASAEQWEGVLIEFSDITVTADSSSLDFGEWRFDDGSGDARGDDAGSITFVPTVNDKYGFLRGIGWFSFGNYKVQPRTNADIEFQVEAFEIAEIQGEGERSPFAPTSGNDPGQVVRTLDNIVTATGTNGFFIQTPDDRPSDSLPLASRGLFVFTGSAPTVQVGDRVNVTGAVAEFFDFTQITQPDAIEVISSGAELPQAVALDVETPSPDPENLSCGDSNFECFEGMRVSVADGFVTAASQSFGSDPVAEAYISADGQRILRGSGEVFPGVPGCATCLVWSGAPELFEIDPDRFGLVTDPLAAGTRFSAEGVIGFSFGDFALWPTTLNLLSTPSLPRPVEPSDSRELTIGSLNALNLFDDALGAPRPIEVCDGGREAVDREVLSATEYAAKLNKLAVYIIAGLRTPDVLAMQEVESVQTLEDLATEIAMLSGVQYSARLVPGNDIGNINNGYLINEARVAIDSVTQLAADECLSTDNSPLHDRPPFLLRGRFIAGTDDWPFAVYNNHLRSLGGIATSDRTRLKRHEQAQSVARVVQDLQTSEPNLPIILVGDKNAFQFSDGFVDVVNQIRGLANPAENLVSLENAGNPDFDDSNITDPPLRQALNRLPEQERYSFIFQGVSQVLDHALLDQTAWRFLSGFGYARGNADYWTGFEFDVDTVARSSDHDGLVLILDTDRLFADGFELEEL